MPYTFGRLAANGFRATNPANGSGKSVQLADATDRNLTAERRNGRIAWKRPANRSFLVCAGPARRGIRLAFHNAHGRAPIQGHRRSGNTGQPRRRRLEADLGRLARLVIMERPTADSQ
jgi:hypothetical protein